MDQETFWFLVGTARGDAEGDDEALPEALQARLMKLSLPEIISFDEHMDVLMATSYRNDLWAAAYIINGGCSDDGFDYFRAWLIAQGRVVFERAVADPATLESVIVMDGSWDAELEDFLYVARNAYEEKAGEAMPERPRPEVKLVGPDWREETVDQLFPKLSQKAESRFEAEPLE